MLYTQHLNIRTPSNVYQRCFIEIEYDNVAHKKDRILSKYCEYENAKGPGSSDSYPDRQADSGSG
jgi:hypothetical protein